MTDEYDPFTALAAREAYEEVLKQNSARGDWTVNRQTPMGEGSPWPAKDSAMVKYVVRMTMDDYAKNKNIEAAILHAVVHGWFEGHIEGYDRAMREMAAAKGQKTEFYDCPDCSAVVRSVLADEHRRWHEEQDKKQS